MAEHKNYSKNNIVQTVVSLFPTYYFSYIAQCLGNIINGLFVGKYLSSLDVAAIGFYNPYYTVICVLPTIICSGARIVCGKYIGRGQKEKVDETYSVAITSLVIIGLLATIASVLFSSTIASLLGTSATVIDKTASYIRAIGFGLLPNMLTQCLIVFLQMRNKSVYSLLSVLLLAICTFGFNFLGVKLLDFNISTIGLLNSLSQLVVFVFVLGCFIKENDMPKFMKERDHRIFKSIILLGFPSAIFGIMVGTRNIEYNKATLLYGGDSAVSALSILNTSAAPYDGVCSAITTITTMLASVYYGEKDRDSIKQLCKVTIILGEILTVLRIVIILLFTPQIATLFGADETVMPFATTIYLIYGLAMPFNVFVIVLMGVYQALGKHLQCSILYFVSVLIVPVLCARFLAPVFGVNGAWIGFILQEIVNIIGIYVIVAVKKKQIFVNYENILFFDESIDVGKHITISIHSQDDVMNVSKKIEDYCINEGVDKKRSMYAGLALEEIATNIIEHGFAKSRKRNKEIDIYCDVDDISKDINLRIKDNAVAFDPYVKINGNDDLTSNIGLRIVSKIAKSMNYQNDFGLNVLNIVF